MLLALVTATFVSPAYAEPTDDFAPEPCGDSKVYVTSPAPVATDVPLDVVPAGLLSKESCADGTWKATLLVAATGDEIVSITQAESEGRLLEVDPGAPLEPDTIYTLRFEPTSGGGELVEIGFTTGSGTTVGLDGAPSLESSGATWSQIGREGQLTVQAEINAVASEDGATIVAFGVEGQQDLDYTSVTGPATVLLTGFAGSTPEAPDQVCIVARQRDMAGAWTESEPDCTSPDTVRNESGGCLNATRGAPTGGLLGLLLSAASSVGLARRKNR